ncbi:hypothetical protein K438DRAFT_2001371 [Mycena galopus ATCC 62051]|nr:hypothetical protein K438DRAFT_2001371 [Mycena galopus ATCC 62051]
MFGTSPHLRTVINVVANEAWLARAKLLEDKNAPGGVVKFFQQLVAPMDILESAKASKEYLADVLKPQLEDWSDARDKAMEAMVKGYLVPPNGDWGSEFEALLKLPIRAPVLEFVEQFLAAGWTGELAVHVVGYMLAQVLQLRQNTGFGSSAAECYINNLVMTLALSHIGELWATRKRVGEGDREEVDRGVMFLSAWMTLTKWVPMLELPDMEDTNIELRLLLNIGIQLYQVHEDVRVSMLIHPIFQLPALIHYWGKTAPFLSKGAIKYARFIVIHPANRKDNMARMLKGFCNHMNPALINFLDYVGI